MSEIRRTGFRPPMAIPKVSQRPETRPLQNPENIGVQANGASVRRPTPPTPPVPPRQFRPPSLAGRSVPASEELALREDTAPRTIPPMVSRTAIANTKPTVAATRPPMLKPGASTSSGSGFKLGTRTYVNEDVDDDEMDVANANVSKQDDKFEKLSGKIQRIIYAAADGFTVYLVRTKASDGLIEDITVNVNSAHKFKLHDAVHFRGEWGTYKGKKTFKAVIMMHDIPPGARGVIMFIKSGAIPGVGARTAEKLAKAAGDNLESIIGDAEALMKTGVVTKGVAEKIADGWNNSNAQPELIAFLGKYGLGIMLISRVIKKYGAACKAKIETNPWQLAEDISGIGFPTADQIGLTHGHTKESPNRLKAGLKYALGELTSSEGHCGVPREMLVMKAQELLKVDGALIASQIDRLVEDGKVYENQTTGLIYPYDLYMAEKKLVEGLKKLMFTGDAIDEADARQALEEAVSRLGFRRDESQINAALMAITNPVSIITGGPGTGKSTTQKMIVETLRTLGRKILAAAPTGRAAKRLADVSGLEASTMHRLLKYDAIAGGFTHDRSNPLEADRIIVDEFSMVELKIAASFVDAVKPTAGLTIVGDVDQLPSVGAGQVLRDLIESDKIPVTRLKTVHRQAGDSGIIVGAAYVNAGQYPFKPGENLNGFELVANFRDQGDEDAIRKTVVHLMAEKLPAMGYNPVDDIQVLSPMRQYGLGVDVLNAELKAKLNPLTEENGIVFRPNAKQGDDKKAFSLGDRVMHLRNDYTKSVFNGEVGIVDYIGERVNESGSREKYMRVDYAGHKAFYGPGEVSDVELSWASTVHKSQGCEFPVAIIVCSNAHKRMLNRNLIYTAITRAKKLCILVGNKNALEYAAATADVNKRFTGLIQLLGADRPHEAKPEDRVVQIEQNVEPDFMEFDIDDEEDFDMQGSAEDYASIFDQHP